MNVIYAYYEGNANYKMNLLYFLKNGYLSHVNYTFVINGLSTVEFPQRDNITVIRRENTGFDFQGYYHGLLSLKKRNLLQPTRYNLFLNCTVRGPFLPSYANRHIYWYTPFLDLLNHDQTKSGGSTINGYPTPHVQTYAFIMDYETVTYLLDKNFFKVCKTRGECIKEQEIALSQTIVAKGWNINCLVPEYRDLDYRNQVATVSKKDIISAKEILGRDLVPYEVVFIKTNLGDPTNHIASLTDLNWSSGDTIKYICQKITYGTGEKKSIDVTTIVQQLGYINSRQLQPNTLFGDPFPEQAKTLFIYVDKQARPIVLRELENQIVHNNNQMYIFDNRTTTFLCYQYPLRNGTPNKPPLEASNRSFL